MSLLPPSRSRHHAGLSTRQAGLPAGQAGVALPELLLGVFVLATVTTAILGLATLGTRSALLSEQRVVAQAIAKEKSEIVRTLPYDQVGYSAAICVDEPDFCGGGEQLLPIHPPGVIPRREIVTRNNQRYIVRTTITLIDDPLNGPNASAPGQLRAAFHRLIGQPVDAQLSSGLEDFKQVEIQVTPPTSFGSQGSDEAAIQAVSVTTLVTREGTSGSVSSGPCTSNNDCAANPTSGTQVCCGSPGLCQPHVSVAGCPTGYVPSTDGCQCEPGPSPSPTNPPDQGQYTPPPPVIGNVCPQPFAGPCMASLGYVQMVVSWSQAGGICLPVTSFVDCGGPPVSTPWCDLEPQDGHTDCGAPEKTQYQLGSDCQDPGCPPGGCTQQCGNPNDVPCPPGQICNQNICHPDGRTQCNDCAPEMWESVNADGAVETHTAATRATCCYAFDSGSVTQGIPIPGDNTSSFTRPCRATGEYCTSTSGGTGTCRLKAQPSPAGCQAYECSAQDPLTVSLIPVFPAGTNQPSAGGTWPPTAPFYEPLNKHVAPTLYQIELVSQAAGDRLHIWIEGNDVSFTLFNAPSNQDAIAGENVAVIRSGTDINPYTLTGNDVGDQQNINGHLYVAVSANGTSAIPYSLYVEELPGPPPGPNPQCPICTGDLPGHVSLSIQGITDQYVGSGACAGTDKCQRETDRLHQTLLTSIPFYSGDSGWCQWEGVVPDGQSSSNYPATMCTDGDWPMEAMGGVGITYDRGGGYRMVASGTSHKIGDGANFSVSFVDDFNDTAANYDPNDPSTWVPLQTCSQLLNRSVGSVFNPPGFGVCNYNGATAVVSNGS